MRPARVDLVLIWPALGCFGVFGLLRWFGLEVPQPRAVKEAWRIEFPGLVLLILLTFVQGDEKVAQREDPGKKTASRATKQTDVAVESRQVNQVHDKFGL